MKIKRFIVAVVSLQLLDAGRCCPQRVTDYRTIVRGRHGGEPGHGGAAWGLDTAWTHDRWWLQAAEVQNNAASLPKEIFSYDSPSSICMERGSLRKHFNKF